MVDFLDRQSIFNNMVELSASHLDTVFHALGDATRRTMLRDLSRGERTVSQLAQPFDISLAAASKHIKALENAGLIRREVRGRTHVCRLSPERLAEAHEWLDFYRQFWGSRLDILEQMLREDDQEKSLQMEEMTMADIAMPDAYGRLVEPTTLKIERLLPGPIDRVWAYLTQSELRRRWLASGEMRLAPDAPFELVWRNDELSDPPGRRPEGFSEEDRMASRIITVVPPHRLVFSWGEGGEVSIELQALGKDVLLTLVHRRLADRRTRLDVSAGWHVHLDILAARLQEKEPGPFWDTWLGLKEEYERRIP